MKILFNTIAAASVGSLISISSAAETPRKVLFYKTGENVFYASDAENFSASTCKISLKNSTSGEILETKGDLIKVRFQSDTLNGCLWDQLRGRDIKEGWLKKSEVTYAANDEEATVNDDLGIGMTRPPLRPEPARAAEEPCADETLSVAQNNIQDIAVLTKHLEDVGADMKTPDEVEKYLACYPLNSRGAEAYKKYEPAIMKATEVIKGTFTSGILEVHPTLFKCLLRRESGYDTDNRSHTGAAGLGQHTEINIQHINNRINAKGSWEGKLWKRYFDKMKTTSEGRKMLEECPGTRGGKEPKFASKADAYCPLNSIAASAIYNIQVQRALRNSSNVETVSKDDRMNYLLSIGAAYNLGDGAASRAVDDLQLDGWIDAIKNKSENKSKRREVASHIEALRNCMQKDNWAPMHAGDRPLCELPRKTLAPKKSARPKPRPEIK